MMTAETAKTVTGIPVIDVLREQRSVVTLQVEGCIRYKYGVGSVNRGRVKDEGQTEELSREET